MDFDSYSDKLTKPRAIPLLSFLEGVLRTFSSGERLLFYTFTIFLGASAFALLAGLNASVSVNVPAAGGSLTEGEVGSARFINPVLTLSQPDEDLVQLVYSGLTRIHPDGTVIADLASRYDTSADGTTYTFTLRKDAKFHDGTPVTAADVVFTIEAAQNPEIKSPRRADWEGVQVSSPDSQTVIFKLPHAYAPFIENTTLGILPKHIWQNVSAEEFPFSPANTHPVGSGPYRIVRTDTDATGTATRYELAPFSQYVLGKPYLKRITFIFYPNQKEMMSAFEEHKIDAMAGIAPSELKTLTRRDFSIAHVTLPRVFGIFFNQSRAPVLADAAARAALLTAVDKQEIVTSVLGGYGVALESAIPPGVTGTIIPAAPIPFAAHAASSSGTATTSNTAATDVVRAILSRGGWTFLPAQAGSETSGVWKRKKVELSLTLATADEPELVATANVVAEYWRAAGIKVAVQVYPLSELNTNVIRPRAYDAVLFGEVVGRTADLFAFWHSSQRNDPGLNLAMYANAKVDSYLARARATTDKKQREKLYAQFNEEIDKDDPAIFLYSPEFIYVVPASLQGVQLGAMTTPSERYQSAYKWYMDTERVWSIFTNNIN